MTADAEAAGAAESRRYPARPIVGVGAVVVVAGGAVVLVRRKHAPLVGRWTLPGGLLELGESLRAGVAREVQEETGLDVEVGPIIEAVDHVTADALGRTEYHFVIVDYLCRLVAGTLEARSDAAEVALVAPPDLGAYDLTERTRMVIDRGLELYTAGGRHQ